MTTITGTVEKVSTNYGKYSILVDGTWYGTKQEWAKVKPNPGDEVTFDNGGGKFLKNVTIITKGSGTVPGTGSSTGGSTGGKRYRANGESGGFPVHPLAYERCLDRRNALQVAANIVSHYRDDTIKDPELAAQLVLELAKKFEAYSTGDIEREMAEQMFTEDGNAD